MKEPVNIILCLSFNKISYKILYILLRLSTSWPIGNLNRSSTFHKLKYEQCMPESQLLKSWRMFGCWVFNLYFCSVHLRLPLAGPTNRFKVWPYQSIRQAICTWGVLETSNWITNFKGYWDFKHLAISWQGFNVIIPTQEGKGIVNWLVSHAGIIKYNVRKDYMIIDWNVKYRKWFGQAGTF